MSLEEAKQKSVETECKIRHRFFLPDEYIYCVCGFWLTEDKYKVPAQFWASMVDLPQWQQDWSVVE